MFRRFGLVTFVPVNSLWFDRTHFNAGTAMVHFVLSITGLWVILFLIKVLNLPLELGIGAFDLL